MNMDRRNFLTDFFYWMLAFFFGYTAKMDIGSTVSSNFSAARGQTDLDTLKRKTDWVEVFPAGNGSNDAVEIQRKINNGARTIVLYHTGVSYNMMSGIDMKDCKFLIGIGKPTLDYSRAPKGTVGITTGWDDTTVEGINLRGNGAGKDSTGFRQRGSRINVQHIEISEFHKGVDLINDHTYMGSYSKFLIFNCAIGVYGVKGSTDDWGERFNFTDGTFGDNKVAFHIDGEALTVFFENVSIDYNASQGIFGNGQFYFSNCHIETRSEVTKQGYMFEIVPNSSPSLNFSTSALIMFNIEFVVKPGVKGFIGYRGCRFYFQPSGQASNMGTGSEMEIAIPAGKTKADFFSPAVAANTLAIPSIMATKSVDAPAVMAGLSIKGNTNKGAVTIPEALPRDCRVLVRFG